MYSSYFIFLLSNCIPATLNFICLTLLSVYIYPNHTYVPTCLLKYTFSYKFVCTPMPTFLLVPIHLHTSIRTCIYLYTYHTSCFVLIGTYMPTHLCYTILYLLLHTTLLRYLLSFSLMLTPCIPICIYTHTYIHTYIYTYTYIYIHPHIYTYIIDIPTYLPTCVRSWPFWNSSL